MRWGIALLFLLHGLIHFMGAAKGFGWAELPRLTQPVSRAGGAAWLGAGILVIAATVALGTSLRPWWILALVAAVISQAMIVSAWPDAKMGTVVNVVMLLAASYGFASTGPFSLRAEYTRAAQQRWSEPRAPLPVVTTEEDLGRVPEPVQRYLRQAGAVGEEHATHFRARWRGRIRGTQDDPWMEFTAEQHNFVDDPARFFLMDATRSGLPVDVLHVFREESASMRVRLLSVLPLVHSTGPDLTRAETVTLLNDLAILAPSALLSPDIRWEAIDESTARAEYTLGPNTVGAVLSFDEAGRLTDFVSEDRLVASPDGSRFTRQRWSTPLSEYRSFGPWTVAGHGEGWWHPEEAEAFVYIELDLIDLEVNPPPPM
ncbi:MAG: hypothetical protein HKO53_04470 [Gemmatimonadetes bacterium]|nr:hypothetical protein [Gemmatimonadota bacterium]